MAQELLVTALEAAEYLGISFSRFKVAIWRGMGLDPKRRPNGTEAKPVVGGWSARSAKYRASDIRRMHEQYPFRANRAPDQRWLRIASQPTRSVPPMRNQLKASSVPTLPSLTGQPKPPATREVVSKGASRHLFEWLL